MSKIKIGAGGTATKWVCSDENQRFRKSCYGCGSEFVHKKIKWTKRMLDKKWLATQHAAKTGEDVNKIMADMDWLSDNVPAAPNEIFGHYEY